jgi:hypothetical protein
MSIKDFSQKNSVVFFYTTIVFVIISIVFGFMAFYTNHKGLRGNDFGRQGTMQRVNRGNFQQKQGFTNQGDPSINPQSTVTGTTTTEVTQ